MGIEHNHLISREERNAIAEIEATTEILKLVVRLTGMRFAAIAKFSDDDWVACSVNDQISLGIRTGESFPLEQSMCSNMIAERKTLYVPSISHDERYRSNISSQVYGFDSCISVPIFVHSDELFGALCVLDPSAQLDQSHETLEVLQIFCNLIGRIFSWHKEGVAQEVPA